MRVGQDTESSLSDVEELVERSKGRITRDLVDEMAAALRHLSAKLNNDPSEYTDADNRIVAMSNRIAAQEKALRSYKALVNVHSVRIQTAERTVRNLEASRERLMRELAAARTGPIKAAE